MTERDEEIEGLRQQLADARRECAILHSLDRGRASIEARNASPTPNDHWVKCLEHTVQRLDDVLSEFARHDCYDYFDDDKPCTCPGCVAKRVLTEVHDWRYGGSREEPFRRFVGAMAHRITNGWNPRETKIHTQWAKRVSDDYTLGLILSSDTTNSFNRKIDWPSARDWYVATSVVQWLATNVGMSVLEGAGFKYTQWDEDRASYEAKRDREVTFPSPATKAD